MRGTAVATFALAAAAAVVPETALAAPANLAARLKAAEATQGNLDHIWVLVAAALVFFMQAGFLLLEAGMVRSKNAVNVAQKNIADFVIAVTMFALVGFMLMFGDSVGGWFGLDGALFGLNELPDWTYTFFIFQVVFCGTAATIVAGAAAERMRFAGYLLSTLLIAALIYPIFGHWAWGNLLKPENAALLADMGFVDFAGSTVVHAVGGWVALAALLVLGPRLGRFAADGSNSRIQGHSPVLATMGGLILWIGWIGFNGGSTTAATPAVAGIVMNTMIAGAGGGVVSMGVGRWVDGVYRPDRSINGVLGGLVGVTAGAAVVDPAGAAFLGATGGLVALGASQLLETWRIDDGVGAVPVHGFAGAWGTVALAFVAPMEALPMDGRLSQALLQLAGTGLAFVWAFGIAYIAFSLINKLGTGLRVSRQDEMRGLNEAEHQTRLGTGEAVAAMMTFSRGQADINARLQEDMGDEAGELAFAFNRVMDNVTALMNQVLRHGETLDSAAQDLDSLVEGTRENADLTAQSAEALRRRMDALSAAAEQGAAAVKRARQDGADVAERAGSLEANVAAAADSANEINESSAAISEANDAARKTVDTARTESERANSSVAGLGEAVSEIEKTLAFIEEVAGKTNMLALNATVEAQRAGEAGKGFAVVAQEVKNLAKQTSEAVETIRSRIQNVRGEADRTREVVGAIDRTSAELEQAVGAIDAAVQRQQAATGTIDENMATARQSVADTRQRAQDAVDQLEQLTRAIDNVAEESRAMDGDVQSLEEVAQRRSGRVERLQNTARAVLDSSGKLTQLVRRMAGGEVSNEEPGAPVLPAAS